MATQLKIDGIPPALRDARRWTTEGSVDPSLPPRSDNVGSSELTDLDGALAKSADGIQFMLGDGWVGVELFRGCNTKTDEPVWWAKDILQLVSSYAEIRPDGHSILVLAQSGDALPEKRFASTTYGFDCQFLISGRVELTGRMLGDHAPADRTAELTELKNRMTQVVEGEEKDSRASTDPSNNSIAAISGVSLPGFGPGIIHGNINGRGVDELRANEVNRYQSLWEFATGSPTVESIPVRLQIGRSNICNFKCVYCADHRVGNDIPRTKLDGATWESLSQLIPRTGVIAFHGVSEFLLDPDFFDILKICSDARVGLTINTNGSICTPKYIDALVNYPEHLEVFFSVDAATAETYHRVRGWDFYRLLDNIKRYMDAFSRRKSTTNVGMSFVVMRTTITEMTPFVYLGKAMGVNFVSFLSLNEWDTLDWEIVAKDGMPFNYKNETPSHFAAEHNRLVKNARRAAEILGIHAVLPAPLPETPVVALPVLEGVST